MFFTEIAISICALHIHPTIMPVQASEKLGIALYAVDPTIMKSTPGRGRTTLIRSADWVERKMVRAMKSKGP